MSYISDKIAEVRGQGHVVPAGIEELFLAIEEEIGLDKKQKEKEPVKQIADQSEENPIDGERIDS